MTPYARFSGLVATDVLEVTHDAADLDAGGWWAIVLTYEGHLTAARFGRVEPRERAHPVEHGGWTSIARDEWTSSMSRQEYMDAVETIRDAIAAGTVYQTNVCRVLSAPRQGRDLRGLAALLDAQHPAPHAGVVF